MPTLTIKRIKSISGLAVFRDFSADVSLPSFRKQTLIYGFNGSGKTTLSRIFSSLETGQLHGNLPAGGEFEIELSDGTRITNAKNLDQLKGKLLTFSTDFIEQNIQWSENRAKPVFYIGKDQAALASTLNQANEKLAALEADQRKAVDEQAHFEVMFAHVKREVARDIADELMLGRNYTATHLSSDYSQVSYDPDLILDEGERQTLRSIIREDVPLPKIDALPNSPIETADHIERVRKIILETIGSIAIEELATHSQMVKWIKDGLEYHREHELEKCLFCGNALSKARKQALAEIVGERFNKLVVDVHELYDWSNTYLDRIEKLKAALPSRNDIAKDLRETFDQRVSELGRQLISAELVLRHARHLIEQKVNAPNVPIEELTFPTAHELELTTDAMRQATKHLSDIIERHNSSHDDFASVQADATKRLKLHFLSKNYERHGQLDQSTALSAEKIHALLQQIDAQKRSIAELDQQLRQHGGAAQKINKLVSNYLGHAELEIAAIDDGYELRRNQTVASGLSEGEKTAIAFCYFLSTVEADGRRPQDLVILVDDPISSLDTKALHYAFSSVRTYLANAAQLILLTHNIQFMNEAKKWLKDRTEKADLPPLKWSSLKHGFDHGGGDQWQGRGIQRKRSLRSCGRSMC